MTTKLTVDDLVAALRRRRGTWRVNEYGKIRNGRNNCPLQSFFKSRIAYRGPAEDAGLPYWEIISAADDRVHVQADPALVQEIRAKLLTLVREGR